MNDEPSNETELGGIPGSGPSYSAYSKITFLAPNGVYDYNATSNIDFQDSGGGSYSVPPQPLKKIHR